MKRWMAAAVAVGLVVLVAGAAGAQMGWGMGPGMGGMAGPGIYGHGTMGQGGSGWYGCPGMMGPGMGMMGPGMMAYGQPGASQVTEDQAKELAQQYADRYLKGFTVDKVLPFAGMGGMTMYSVELKGPKDEARVLHVNPLGNVMPFGGPGRRAG